MTRLRAAAAVASVSVLAFTFAMTRPLPVHAVTTLTVDTTADPSAGDCSSGFGSLRHCIQRANSLLSGEDSNIVNADPLLDTLKDNGGPTKTQALLENSPAIGAANEATCPTTDQRGLPRLSLEDTDCDIGAYEVQPVTDAAASAASVAATVAPPVQPFPGVGLVFAGGVLVMLVFPPCWRRPTGAHQPRR
jgi:hypothetical protein